MILHRIEVKPGFWVSGVKTQIRGQNNAEVSRFWELCNRNGTSEDAATIRVLSVLQAHPYLDFVCNGEAYLIQADNNKGCDYLSLWRMGQHPMRLGQALYEVMDGFDSDVVQELLEQPLIHGKSFLFWWKQGDIQMQP